MLLSLIYCHLTVTNGKGEILVSITKCISRTDDVLMSRARENGRLSLLRGNAAVLGCTKSWDRGH